MTQSFSGLIQEGRQGITVEPQRLALLASWLIGNNPVPKAETRTPAMSRFFHNASDFLSYYRMSVVEQISNFVRNLFIGTSNLVHAFDFEINNYTDCL